MRYDKRTYVYQKEMLTETDLTLYDETVDDAVSAMNVLWARKIQIIADFHVGPQSWRRGPSKNP